MTEQSVSTGLSRSILCVMGSTASGKTDAVCALADRFPIRIISVDSALIYRQMNIGTAKPSAEELAQYPHALVDMIDPTETYSAAQFAHDATRLIEQAFDLQQIPVLVGGTLLYFSALLKGLSPMPVSDPTVRLALMAECEQLGLPALHARLMQVDSISGARIHANDTQRILRALEVFDISGKPMSQWWAQGQGQVPPWQVTQWVLQVKDKAIYQQRMATRFEQMLQLGLVDEVDQLRHDYPELTANHPSQRSVGYRQVWDVLEGRLPATQLRERGLIATRQYAKRQLTWLKTETPHACFDTSYGLPTADLYQHFKENFTCVS